MIHCLLSEMANGIKLKLMINFKGLKTIQKSDFQNYVVVTMSIEVSMNNDLMTIYKQSVWGTSPNCFFKSTSVLVIDRTKPHLKTIVKSNFKQYYKIDFVIIPVGLTPLLQSADVQRNKIIKAEMRCLWSGWLGNGE